MLWIMSALYFLFLPLFYSRKPKEKTWTVQFISRMRELLIHTVQQEVSFIINVMKINAAGHKKVPYEDDWDLQEKGIFIHLDWT